MYDASPLSCLLEHVYNYVLCEGQVVLLNVTIELLNRHSIIHVLVQHLKQILDDFYWDFQGSISLGQVLWRSSIVGHILYALSHEWLLCLQSCLLHC